MNTIRKITATLAAALIATAAMAQNGVEQAIKIFVDGRSNGKYITANNYQEAQEDDSQPKSFYREYKFSISKRSKQFEQLREAFEEGACDYYEKNMKAAGENVNSTWNVGYGAQSEYSVQFGAYKDRNYSLLYVRDSDNQKWRTVYGLVWYNDKENTDNYKGSLHIIYSPDPKKMERKKTTTTVDWDDFNQRMKELDEALDGLNISLDGKNITVIGPDTVYSYGNGVFTNGTKVQISDPNDYVTSAEQFLSRFGTLRSLYLDAYRNQRSASYKTSLVNKIVSLCKNKGSLLSADEKEVCIFGIKEMKDRTYNDYDKKLLSVAQKALK